MGVALGGVVLYLSTPIAAPTVPPASLPLALEAGATTVPTLGGESVALASRVAGEQTAESAGAEAEVLSTRRDALATHAALTPAVALSSAASPAKMTDDTSPSPLTPSEPALPSAPATPSSSAGADDTSSMASLAPSGLRRPLAESQVECHAQLGMWYVGAVDGLGQVVRVLSRDAVSGILNVQAYTANRGKTGRLSFKRGNATLQLEPRNLRQGPFQLAPGGRAPPEIAASIGRGQKRPPESVASPAKQRHKASDLDVPFGFKRSLNQLTTDLGFSDSPELRDTLTRHHGNVSACLREMLGDQVRDCSTDAHEDVVILDP